MEYAETLSEGGTVNTITVQQDSTEAFDLETEKPSNFKIKIPYAQHTETKADKNRPYTEKQIIYIIGTILTIIGLIIYNKKR